MSLKVRVVGRTEFVLPRGEDIDPWEPEWNAPGGLNLAEFAGRACYQSWTKPNPKTATNEGYIAHIIEVGHYSVLEHGQLSFYFTGISRSLTHELIRHRHFSYSQLSQRYVDSSRVEMVEPDIIAEDPSLHEFWKEAVDKARETYGTLNGALDTYLADELAWLPRSLRVKLARQAARSVLPNATETRIIVTGNYRAWRHFLRLRGSQHADVEIRDLAFAVYEAMLDEVPAVVDDFRVETIDDMRVLTTPYAEYE